MQFGPADQLTLLFNWIRQTHSGGLHEPMDVDPASLKRKLAQWNIRAAAPMGSRQGQGKAPRLALLLEPQLPSSAETITSDSRVCGSRSGAVLPSPGDFGPPPRISPSDPLQQHQQTPVMHNYHTESSAADTMRRLPARKGTFSLPAGLAPGRWGDGPNTL